MTKEILYTSALDENGDTICINDAEKGRTYYCPICKGKFILRKSGKTGKLKSLNLFMEKSHHSCAIRVYSGKLRTDQVVLPSGKKYHLCSIPYYMLSRLDEVIESLSCPLP